KWAITESFTITWVTSTLSWANSKKPSITGRRRLRQRIKTSIRSSFKRKLMTQKTGSVNRWFFALLGITLVAALVVSCTHNKVVLPAYDVFAKTRGESVPHNLQEIYGKYYATFNDRKFSSTYSLLLDPGKAAYMEVTDPAKALLFAVSLEPDTITMFWAKEKRYVSEKATAENINAILGLPIMPDDLLLAIGGHGLTLPQQCLKTLLEGGWSVMSRPYKF